MYTSSFNPDPEDRSAAPGDVLELQLDDFEDGYLTLRHPGDEADIRALEQWECSGCGWAQWAQLDFHRVDPRHYRFGSASTAPLTPETLRRIHFLSRKIDFWVRANPGQETDQILPLIEHLLPAAAWRPQQP